MSTTGRNAFVQTFAKVVDSFVDRCLWQVIPDQLQCTFLAVERFLALSEVCKMPEAFRHIHKLRSGEFCGDEIGTVYPQTVLVKCKNSLGGRAKHDITLSELEVIK